MKVWLSIWDPAMTVYNPATSVYFPSLPASHEGARWEPTHLPPLLLSSVLTSLPHCLWLHCGSHLIIFIATSHHFSISWEIVSSVFLLGCHSAWLGRSPGCLKLVSAFSWASLATGHPVQPPCLDHHENHLIWVDLSLMAPLESLGHCSRCPASLPDCLESYLIWVDSAVAVPLSFHVNSQLSSLWDSFVGWSLLILYCTLFTFCSFDDWIFGEAIWLIPLFSDQFHSCIFDPGNVIHVF